MSFFKDLKVQQSGVSTGSLRVLAYDDGTDLGTELPQIDYTRDVPGGLDDSSIIADEVKAAVANLKAEGKLPETALVDAGQSHVVVSLSSYSDDDVYAIYDTDA